MSASKTIDFTKQKGGNLFHFILCIILISLNLSVSLLIRQKDIFFIANEYPLGLSFSQLQSIAIITLVTTVLLVFRYFNKYAITSILIMAGAWSNFFERWLLFYSVTDYIRVFNSYFNIADIQVWTGLILLNVQVWFTDKKSINSQTKTKKITFIN